MAHKIQLARQVTAQPYVIETSDIATRNYLDALNAPTIKSDTATTQWALAIATGKYIVSAEAYKRAQAGRLS